MIISKHVPWSQSVATSFEGLGNLLGEEIYGLRACDLMKADSQITSAKSITVLGKRVELSRLVHWTLFFHVDPADEVLV